MILLPFFLQVYRVFGLEIQFFTSIFDTQENSYTIFYPKGMMIMIYTDTHLHTSFSSDSDTPMELMIKKGIELGMKTLCFTEHYDPCYPDTPDKLDFLLDFENYKKTLFTMMLLIGCIGCFLLGFIDYWFAFLIVFLIAKIGFSGSLIFYDSMLISPFGRTKQKAAPFS